MLVNINIPYYYFLRNGREHSSRTDFFPIPFIPQVDVYNYTLGHVFPHYKNFTRLVVRVLAGVHQ